MAGKDQKKHTEAILTNADIDQLLSTMNELEQAAQKEMIAALSKELSDADKKAVVSRLTNQAVITDGKVKDWLVPAISSSYIAGAKIVDEQLAKFGIKTSLGDITIELLKSSPDLRPHLEAVNALLSDAYLDFGSGITGFVRNVEHVLNDALRQQIQSKIALGRLTGSDIRTIKNAVKAQLKDRGFQVLLDRGGKEWTLDRYTEMLARTHIIRANTEATTNRAGNYEIDIVEVSTHGTLDDLCGQYEGKIYSLSGRSRNYKKLPAYPPFHPNCKHTLLMRPDLE